MCICLSCSAPTAAICSAYVYMYMYVYMYVYMHICTSQYHSIKACAYHVICVGAARLLCNEVLAIKRQPRSGCRYTCTARSPKGPLGSTRHLAHIAGHIGLMHIDKEMVHSYREREREGRRAVASDLYMPGGKYFFLYIYLLTHSILFNHLSLTACYHKGAALLRQ